MLTRLIRHPLLHFILAGALLFGLYNALNPASQADDEILIDDEIVHRSIRLFEKEWGRKPTRKELKGLMNRYVQQEVFYRQALKMKLDHNDELIKRRMEQKLRFITQDLATLKEPTDAELKNWYESKKEKYKLPVQFTLSVLYFNPDHRPTIWQDAAAVKQAIEAKDPAVIDQRALSDPLPFQSPWQSSHTATDLSAQFGQPFVDSLLRAPIKKWLGPIPSGYGLQLVYISNLQPSRDPVWADIESTVLRDFQYEQSEAMNEKVYQGFLKDFPVRYQLNDSSLAKWALEKP